MNELATIYIIHVVNIGVHNVNQELKKKKK